MLLPAEEVSGALQENWRARCDAGGDTASVWSCRTWNIAKKERRNNSSGARLPRPSDKEALERRELVGMGSLPMTQHLMPLPVDEAAEAKSPEPGVTWEVLLGLKKLLFISWSRPLPGLRAGHLQST